MKSLNTLFFKSQDKKVILNTYNNTLQTIIEEMRLTIKPILHKLAWNEMMSSENSVSFKNQTRQETIA